MVKRSDCTTKIVVALLIGLLIGGVFMVLVQNKFFKQPKPDDDTRAVAKQPKPCTYTCKIGLSVSATKECSFAELLLKEGKGRKVDGEVPSDSLLVKRMNDVGWRVNGGSSENGWNAFLVLPPPLKYRCDAHATSSKEVVITRSFVGECPPIETVCPNGIMMNPPSDAQFSDEGRDALQEATNNVQEKINQCMQATDKQCQPVTGDVTKRYWETYENNKIVTEKLADKKTFCDRRDITLLKDYTSNEQYDSIEFAKDKFGASRMETIKQYLQALSNPSQVAQIKDFILADLANGNPEIGGGLVSGAAPSFKAYPSGSKQGNTAYGVSDELGKSYKNGFVRSIWHIHAIDKNGNPEQEGPSGDPEHPEQENDDFNAMYSYTEGEAVITYIGKDANGKVCFNVKFFTRKNIVVDLGDYDP
ncbi:MAG: hypothetical protein Q7K43_05635 [Candidatus Woesearchaeota archaeon]|nr:hypothetical protein [Candidatus Woesearchaeota archaeon]